MKISKRSSVVALAAAAATIAVSGVAFAFWTSTGSGAAAAKAGTISFTVNATAPAFGAAGTAVHPGTVAGGTGDTAGGSLFVTINNTSGFAVKATQVAQSGGVSVATPIGTCPSDSGTWPSVSTFAAAFIGTQAPAAYGAATTGPITAYTLPSPVTIPTGTTTFELTNIVGMGTASLTGCQGGTFSFPVTVTATS